MQGTAVYSYVRSINIYLIFIILLLFLIRKPRARQTPYLAETGRRGERDSLRGQGYAIRWCLARLNPLVYFPTMLASSFTLPQLLLFFLWFIKHPVRGGTYTCLSTIAVGGKILDCRQPKRVRARESGLTRTRPERCCTFIAWVAATAVIPCRKRRHARQRAYGPFLCLQTLSTAYE